MRLDIRYSTRFEYDAPVHESQNELRAAPMSDPRQLLISYRVTTTPASRVFSFTDYWGTRVDAFGVREAHESLEVVAEASVETRRAPMLTASPHIDEIRGEEFREEHLEYLLPTPHADWGPGVADAARRVLDSEGPDLVSVVLAIHRKVGESIRYQPGSTYVGVEVEDVIGRGVGVCQDFAHLAVAMCRSVGIPARYVSGYLFTTDDATGEDPDAEAVRVQTHAWFEAAVPGADWIALDPTNAAEVGLRHVKIGHGRDYDDVPPLRGVVGGEATPSLGVAVDIRRLTPKTVAADAARAAAAAQQRLAEARERRARSQQPQQAQQ